MALAEDLFQGRVRPSAKEKVFGGRGEIEHLQFNNFLTSPSRRTLQYMWKTEWTGENLGTKVIHKAVAVIQVRAVKVPN